MNRRLLLTALLTCSLGAALCTASETEKHFEWDGSRVPPVHRFPMYDEFGQQIVPSFSQALPMSSRNTCGTCHSYSTVEQGWHFNSSLGTAPPGRPGEPWVWTDEATGTWLPLSYRRWPNTWHPEDLGMSNWRFTQIFGRHLPGGDMAEPEDDLKDPESRWDLSGKVEINCLACHNASHEQDQGEWAKQMMRENFRWAATAAAGLGDVNGMATRVRSHWTIFDGPNRDDTEFAVAPSVDYYEDKFDSKNRTVFNIVHQPPDRNCLQCHSVTAVDTPHANLDGDVHMLSGLKCADCHRNGLDHKMIRGFEGEEKLPGMEHAAAFSCRGCHIGAENGSMQTVKAGRLGAPKPVHAGIPPVHFEKMACTTCHSGPMPDKDLTLVRTSRIHRIGIHGRAEWFTDAPEVVEPVFVRNDEGVIEPRRMMWPAFFGRMQGDEVIPLTPDAVSTATAGILDSQQQVARVLTAFMATRDAGTTGYPVLLAGGKAWRTNLDGKLNGEDYATTPAIGESWAWRESGDVFHPLLAESEPGSGELSSDAEQQVSRVLEALAQNAETSQPGLVFGGKLHRLLLDGTLEKTERADKATSAAAWVLVEGETLHPLVSPDLLHSAVETASTGKWATEAQIARVLERLAGADPENSGFVYISSGQLFRRTPEGTLAASDHKAAEPVSWAIGHDVRPTAQSLGVNSCAECHDADSPFFHALVDGTGPLISAANAKVPMHAFQSRDETYERLFGYSFRWRESFKTMLFGTAGLLGLVVGAYTLIGVRRAGRFVGTRKKTDE